jgi:transcriptional antiterminator RfaH
MGVTLHIEGDWREERLWYAVQTRSKSEHIAAAGLLQHGEIDVFCPRLKFQRPTPRGKVWYKEALFPGYLFAKFQAAEYMRAVSYGNAIIRLLKFGDDYAVLPDSAIEQLRAEMGGEDIKEVEIVPQIGDEIEIAAGAFRGMKGIVTNLLGGAQRVRVLIEFLGRISEVEVPAHKAKTTRDPQGAFALS